MSAAPPAISGVLAFEAAVETALPAALVPATACTCAAAAFAAALTGAVARFAVPPVEFPAAEERDLAGVRGLPLAEARDLPLAAERFVLFELLARGLVALVEAFPRELFARELFARELPDRLEAFPRELLARELLDRLEAFERELFVRLEDLERLAAFELFPRVDFFLACAISTPFVCVLAVSSRLPIRVPG